jgi:DNA polymerase I
LLPFAQIWALDYCATDIDALAALIKPMLHHLDLPRALYRGRYMAAVAAVEHAGIPIDMDMLAALRERWDDIKDMLIADVDQDYGVYEGRTFKQDKFEAYLQHNNIPWPRLPTDKLDLKDATFRQMAKAYPRISALRELRSSLSELRFSDLEVGADGRNRYSLFPFVSRTGRNQPSSTKAIFGNSVWLRGLIRPSPGYGLAYLDWSQQEFAIAASLSNDAAMLEAYKSGDPYLKFGQLAGAIPADATKEHPKRELFKACALAVQYGMGPESLSGRIGQPTFIGRDLLEMHHRTFSTFWKWIDGVVTQAVLTGQISTVFGWTQNTKHDVNPRQLLNFPMQAHGSEMMRLACCLGVERGVEIAAPVHDAFLICAPLDRLEDDVARMQDCMAEASRVVLDGFELRSDAKLVRYPDRFMDEARGGVMWDRVMRLLTEPVRLRA